MKNNGAIQHFKTAGKAAYRKLIRGVVDLADDYTEEKATNPNGVVTQDAHAPYLKMAANKGSTQFSDLANTVAREYDFWLNDILASGERTNSGASGNLADIDTSDLRIALDKLHKQQLLIDSQALFMDMTEVIYQLVRADNIAQSFCLSLEQRRCAENPALFLQVAERLESAGYLDRTVESFAPTKKIQARAGQSLSRSELATLIAASKFYLARQLQSQASLLQNACYDRYLQAYFPSQLNNAFKQHLAGHPLANEIKATLISNKIINHAGASFLSLATHFEHRDIFNAVNCYLTFEQVLAADAHRQAIAELDNKVAAKTQYQLLLQFEDTLIDFCHWATVQPKAILPDSMTINDYCRYLTAYVAYYEQNPLTVSAQMQPAAFTVNARDFFLVVQLATEMHQDFANVMALLHDITQALGLQEIQEKLADLPLRDAWQRNVADDLRTDMESVTSQLLRKIVSSKLGSCVDYFKLETVKQCLKPYRRIYQDILTTSPQEVSPYVTLIKSLGSVYLL